MGFRISKPGMPSRDYICNIYIFLLFDNKPTRSMVFLQQSNWIRHLHLLVKYFLRRHHFAKLWGSGVGEDEIYP